MWIQRLFSFLFLLKYESFLHLLQKCWKVAQWSAVSPHSNPGPIGSSHCVEMWEHTQCIQARGHKAAAAGLDTKCNNCFASLENCAGVFESKMHTLILGSTLQKQKETCLSNRLSKFRSKLFWGFKTAFTVNTSVDGFCDFFLNTRLHFPHFSDYHLISFTHKTIFWVSLWNWKFCTYCIHVNSFFGRVTFVLCVSDLSKVTNCTFCGPQKSHWARDGLT